MDKNNLLKTAFIIGILLLIVGDAIAGVGVTAVTSKISCVICRAAQIIFMLAVVVAGIVILLAGLKWAGSPDDPAARNAARLTIIHAIIGLIIIIVAVFFVSYLVSGLFGTLPTDITGWITDTSCASAGC